MIRFLTFVLIGAATLLGAEYPSPSTDIDQSQSATFYKDALPVLQKNCQVCHRPGQIAPMSFTTYDGVRPWAKAIKSAVLTKKMPPWLADPHVGKFRNAPTITEDDVRALVAWVDDGAQEGNPADMREGPQWVDGWRVQPDVVVAMPGPYKVAAKGVGEVKTFILDSPFPNDTWVSSIEIRPGDPSVVHHAVLQLADQPTGGTAASSVDNIGSNCRGKALDPEKLHAVITPPRASTSYYPGRGGNPFERLTGCGTFATLEAIYAPGSSPMNFSYQESAKLIPGGKRAEGRLQL
jgi:mono/diheme cytochrome c family protein